MKSRLQPLLPTGAIGLLVVRTTSAPATGAPAPSTTRTAGLLAKRVSATARCGVAPANGTTAANAGATVTSKARDRTARLRRARRMGDLDYFGAKASFMSAAANP